MRLLTSLAVVAACGSAFILSGQNKEFREGPDSILGQPPIALKIDVYPKEGISQTLIDLLGTPLTARERETLTDEVETVIMGTLTKEGVPVVRYDPVKHDIVAASTSEAVVLSVYINMGKNEDRSYDGLVSCSITERMAVTRKAAAGRLVTAEVMSNSNVTEGANWREALEDIKRYCKLDAYIVVAKYEFKD